MIKTVIFDIDNTLYSYDAAHDVAFSALLDYAERELWMTRSRFIELHKDMKKHLEGQMGKVATIHNRIIRYQNLLEQAGLPISHALTMHHIYWDTLIGASVPTEGAAEVMAELKKRGIRIGIGTDMTAELQFEKLRHLGLLDYIDFMVSSEEAQAEKPDEALFRLCIQKAACAPEECLFVGDSLKKDVAGAENVGMHGIWFCPDKSVTTEAPTVRQLTELLNYL